MKRSWLFGMLCGLVVGCWVVGEMVEPSEFAPSSSFLDDQAIPDSSLSGTENDNTPALLMARGENEEEEGGAKGGNGEEKEEGEGEEEESGGGGGWDRLWDAPKLG
jgi:hypothetical protein